MARLGNKRVAIVAMRRKPGLLRLWCRHRILGESFSSGLFSSYLSTNEVGGEVTEKLRNKKAQQAQSFSGLRRPHGLN